MLRVFTFVLFFSFQDQWGLVQNSHTWATYVKATGETAETAVVDPKSVFTVSWLPNRADRQVVCGVLIRAERGVVDDLEYLLGLGFKKQTDAPERKMDVRMFGPYRIQEKLYDRAKQRLADLKKAEKAERPEVLYKTLECATVAPATVYNGITANWVLEERLDYDHRRGVSATRLLAQQYFIEGLLDSFKETYPAVATQVLDAKKFTFREDVHKESVVVPVAKAVAPAPVLPAPKGLPMPSPEKLPPPQPLPLLPAPVGSPG